MPSTPDLISAASDLTTTLDSIGPLVKSAFDADFFARLVIVLTSVIALVRVYYSVARHRENAASFMLFGIGVFFVTELLHTAEVSMGFAFGLFAVFSMLRYRTEALGIKEMTYLFLVIAIALLSAVAPLPHHELFGLNLAIVGIAVLLETSLLLPHRQETVIEYEKIENIRPDRSQQLIADLKLRTGLQVVGVDIVSISFLKDIAVLRLHYLSDRRLGKRSLGSDARKTTAC